MPIFSVHAKNKFMDSAERSESEAHPHEYFLGVSDTREWPDTKIFPSVFLLGDGPTYSFALNLSTYRPQSAPQSCEAQERSTE